MIVVAGDFIQYATPPPGEDLSREVLSRYSRSNLIAFCDSQVKAGMEQLRGDAVRRNRIYIPELYVQPSLLKSRFRDFLSSGHRAFALVADSGMGKTCWSCHVALECAAMGQPALFYTAFDVRHGIFSAIAEDLGWELSPQHTVQNAVKLFLSVFENEGVLVFVDGLDEIDPAVARDVTDDFLRRTEGTTARLVVSCKSTSWGQIKEWSGVPSRLFEAAGESTVYYRAQDVTSEEFWAVVGRYRDFYQFDGTFEHRALEDCRRSPFLLRIMFEVAVGLGLHNITYTTREYYEAYFEKALGSFGDDTYVVQGLLIDLAGALYSMNTEMAEVDRLGGTLHYNFLQWLPRLLSQGILLSQGSGRAEVVGFYFAKMRDYLAAFRFLDWRHLDAEAFGSRITQESLSGLRLDVLNLYYSLAVAGHQRVLDGFVYRNALEYVSLYESAINKDFPAFKGAFEPYGADLADLDRSIGLVGFFDTVEREISEYGFRLITQGDEKVLLLPVISRGDAETSREQTRTLANIGGVSTLHYRTTLDGFRCQGIASEVVQNEVLEGVDFATRKGLLDESRNRRLLEERVLGVAVRYYKDFLGIRDGFFSDSHFPLRLDQIEKAALYYGAVQILEEAWREERIADGRIPREPDVAGMAVYRWQIPVDEQSDIFAQARAAADRGELLKSAYYEDDDLIKISTLDDIANLRALGVTQIEDAIVPGWDDLQSGSREFYLKWKPETLGAILAKVYSAFLDEYRTLVQYNFPTLCDEFALFKEMPVQILIPIGDEGAPTGYIYECSDTEVTDNSAFVCRSSEVEIDQREQNLQYGGRTLMIRRGDWRHPSLLLDPCLNHDAHAPFELDWHKTVLRNLVYERVRRDLEAAYPKLALRYGAEISVPTGLEKN